MHRTLSHLAGLLAAVALTGGWLAGGPAAHASSGTPVIADCEAHGKLTAHYSAAALQDALNTMPASVKEYSDCYDVIYHQLVTQLGKPATGSSLPVTGSSGGGGSFLPTPVIVVLAVLVAAACGLGALALRRRQADDGDVGPTK